MKQLFANGFCDRTSLFNFVCGFSIRFDIRRSWRQIFFHSIPIPHSIYYVYRWIAHMMSVKCYFSFFTSFCSVWLSAQCVREREREMNRKERRFNMSDKNINQLKYVCGVIFEILWCFSSFFFYFAAFTTSGVWAWIAFNFLSHFEFQ